MSGPEDGSARADGSVGRSVGASDFPVTSAKQAGKACDLDLVSWVSGQYFS